MAFARDAKFFLTILQFLLLIICGSSLDTSYTAREIEKIKPTRGTLGQCGNGGTMNPFLEVGKYYFMSTCQYSRRAGYISARDDNDDEVLTVINGYMGTNGGGGSGYYNGVTSSRISYGGDQSFISTTGVLETGHSGNGYYKITPIN